MASVRMMIITYANKSHRRHNSTAPLLEKKKNRRKLGSAHNPARGAKETNNKDRRRQSIPVGLQPADVINKKGKKEKGATHFQSKRRGIVFQAVVGAESGEEAVDDAE